MPESSRDLRGPLLARGVARCLASHGWSSLVEMSLANGRRADVMALTPDGSIEIIEVKSSVTDFRTDAKWAEYRPFCDRFAFAVPADFPLDLIPADCGLYLADPYGAERVRVAPEHRLDAARRKAVTLRFAHYAARRLRDLTDPEASA